MADQISKKMQGKCSNLMEILVRLLQAKKWVLRLKQSLSIKLTHLKAPQHSRINKK
jgi:hypothetical protein